MAIAISNANAVNIDPRATEDGKYGVAFTISWGESPGLGGEGVIDFQPRPTVNLNIVGTSLAPRFRRIAGLIVDNTRCRNPLIAYSVDGTFRWECDPLVVTQFPVAANGMQIYLSAIGGTMLRDETRVICLDYEPRPSVTRQQRLPPLIANSSSPPWFNASLSMTATGNVDVVTTDCYCDYLDVDIENFAASVAGAGQIWIRNRDVAGDSAIIILPFSFGTTGVAAYKKFQLRKPGRASFARGINLAWNLTSGTVTAGTINFYGQPQ